MTFGHPGEDSNGVIDAGMHAGEDHGSRPVRLRPVCDGLEERAADAPAKGLGGECPGIGIGEREVDHASVDPDDRHPLFDLEAQVVLENDLVTGNERVPFSGVLVHEELVDALRIG